MENFKRIFDDFSREEDGVALTEYLVLLGLLTGAVVTAVTLYGTNMATVWGTWEAWVGSLTPAPGSGTPPPDPNPG